MDLIALQSVFGGGDPITGQAALEGLLAAGDAGEEALFSRPIEVPTGQVRRRWLRYVATRPASVGPRLLASLRSEAQWNDRHAAAILFAGLPSRDPAHQAIGNDLREIFASGTPSLGPAADYARVTAVMAAVGGGDRFAAWDLWGVVNRDGYAWEKLRTHAFRGACLVAARFGRDHIGPVEHFLTKYHGDRQLEVDDSELWLQAYYTFPLWRPGSFVDAILDQWHAHEVQRVRHFGAQILQGVGFRRAQSPILSWLAAEPVPAIREQLLVALAEGGSKAAADTVLQHAERGDVNREAITLAARHASDRACAVNWLERTADADDSIAAEALLSLARMGVKSACLEASLFSADVYRRLNAALAYGFLRDDSRLDDLFTLRDESSGHWESVQIGAALAMLGRDPGGVALHDRLVAFATTAESSGRDLFSLKRALKDAFVEAFDRSGPDARERLAAWRAELQPLDAVIRPVDKTANTSPPRAAAATASHPTKPNAKSTHRPVSDRFRVAFSFAGAQRADVKAVAEAVESRLGRGCVFFDDWYQAYLAGNDADILLQQIYGKRSDLVVVCISAAYDDRPWTMIEHRVVRALAWGAIPGSREAMRVLPLRFADGEVEGWLVNAIAPDVRNQSPEDVAALILERLRLSGA